MSMSGTPVDFDCVVVGAGVEGSAAAWALAKRHHKTLLLEQFSVGHSRGSSHGESRIIRRAYPADTPVYTHIMRDAFPLWLQLQQTVQQQLFVLVGIECCAAGNGGCCRRTGMLWLAPAKTGQVRRDFEYMRDEGMPVELLSVAQVGQRYPMLRYADHYNAMLDCDAGVLAADKCVRALQDEFVRLGGTLIDRTLCSGVQVVDKQLMTVSTAGNTYTTRRLLLCCGPWAGPFLDKHLGLKLPLRTEVMKPCYWPNPTGSHSLSRGFPCLFVQEPDQGTHFYGLPCFEYPNLFKFANHIGYEADADRRDSPAGRQADKQIEVCSAHIAEHMPDLQPQPAIVDTCIYTLSPAQHPFIDRHPLLDNVIIAAGFSGHGFKLAPVVGEIMADLALDIEPKYDLRLFNIPHNLCDRNSKM